MRVWNYTYKTSDGLRHEGEMSAPSKDDVYAELRRQGIRAIKVTERIAPVIRRGLKGLRKRDLALLGCLAVLIAGGAWALSASRPKPYNADAERGAIRRRGAIESQVVEVNVGDRIATARPRKQISGDVTALATNLVHSSERFLACFAQPGVTVGEVETADCAELAEDFYDAAEEGIVIRATDPRELVDLKRIVAGLKAECQMNVSNGRTFEEFVEGLKQRQKMEASYRRSIVDGAGSVEEKNAKLGALNFRKITH